MPSILQNRLLATLPNPDQQRLLQLSESVALVSGEILQSSGVQENVYFPTSGSISLIKAVDEDAALEIGLIGNEGACGTHLALGSHVSAMQVIVQATGSALRVDAADFVRLLKRSRALTLIVNGYICVQLDQLAQMAVCVRYHDIEERLARRLLIAQDRNAGQPIQMTHQLLGSLLGVRRVGITRAASNLQALGFIRYSRGQVTVVNRRGLKGAACWCYAADQRTYQQVLGQQSRAPMSPTHILQSPTTTKKTR